MNDHTRKTYAAFGVEILKIAVLDVLYEHAVSGSPGFLRQDEIRERLGIPRTKPIAGKRVNRLTAGVLEHLKEAKCVKYNKKGGWQITPDGVSLIEGRHAAI